MTVLPSASTAPRSWRLPGGLPLAARRRGARHAPGRDRRAAAARPARARLDRGRRLSPARACGARRPVGRRLGPGALWAAHALAVVTAAVAVVGLMRENDLATSLPLAVAPGPSTSSGSRSASGSRRSRRRRSRRSSRSRRRAADGARALARGRARASLGGLLAPGAPLAGGSAGTSRSTPGRTSPRCRAEPWHWLGPGPAAGLSASPSRRAPTGPAAGARMGGSPSHSQPPSRLALAWTSLRRRPPALIVRLMPLVIAALDRLARADPRPALALPPAPRGGPPARHGRTSTPIRRRRSSGGNIILAGIPFAAAALAVRGVRFRSTACAVARRLPGRLAAKATRGFGGDGDGVDAAASRRGGGRRVRRWGVQRQQHGADPGDHGGRARDLLAGDHPGVAGRALVHQRPLPLPPDGGGGRALSRDPGRAPPGPRQLAGDLHLGDRAGLHERDDGRLAPGRRQDAGGLRLQRPGDARGRGARARESASRSRASWERWAGSRTASARARST